MQYVHNMVCAHTTVLMRLNMRRYSSVFPLLFVTRDSDVIL